MRAWLVTAIVFLYLPLSSGAEDLSFGERFKTSRLAIAGALAVVGLERLSVDDVSSLMVQIYANDDTLENFAAKSGCSALPSNNCLCTDNAEVFDQSVAPLFEQESRLSAKELFAERTTEFSGYHFALKFERSGSVSRGLFKPALQNRLHYLIFIDGAEHGQKKRQQFCAFNGKFKMYTETSGGKYIGLNFMSLGEALSSHRPFAVDHVQVANGEISYKP